MVHASSSSRRLRAARAPFSSSTLRYNTAIAPGSDCYIVKEHFIATTAEIRSATTSVRCQNERSASVFGKCESIGFIWASQPMTSSTVFHLRSRAQCARPRPRPPHRPSPHSGHASTWVLEHSNTADCANLMGGSSSRPRHAAPSTFKTEYFSKRNW